MAATESRILEPIIMTPDRNLKRQTPPLKAKSPESSIPCPAKSTVDGPVAMSHIYTFPCPISLFDVPIILHPESFLFALVAGRPATRAKGNEMQRSDATRYAEAFGSEGSKIPWPPGGIIGFAAKMTRSSTVQTPSVLPFVSQ